MTEQRKLPFVWELNKNGVISHAIGTQHAVENCFQEDAGRYLDGKTRLLMEVQEEDIPILDRLRIANATLSAGIEQLLPQEQAELAHYAKTPIEVLKQLPIMGLPIYMLMMAGYKNLVSMEQTFTDVAQKRNIPIGSLEKIDLPKFEEKFRKDSSKNLLKLLEVAPQHGSIPALFQNLYAAYLSGDEQAVIQIVESDMEQEDFDRNIILANNSIPHLAQPSTIAVGLAHFLFEPSVLTYYREKGIGVRRVQ